MFGKMIKLSKCVSCSKGLVHFVVRTLGPRSCSTRVGRFPAGYAGPHSLSFHDNDHIYKYIHLTQNAQNQIIQLTECCNAEYQNKQLHKILTTHSVPLKSKSLNGVKFTIESLTVVTRGFSQNQKSGRLGVGKG